MLAFFGVLWCLSVPSSAPCCSIAVDRVPCLYQSLINTHFYDDTHAQTKSVFDSWGGAWAGSGNKPGHWEAQGGRAAAASAKVKFKKELKAAIEEKRQKLDECWSLWSNKVCRSPPPECCARMCI